MTNGQQSLMGMAIVPSTASSFPFLDVGNRKLDSGGKTSSKEEVSRRDVIKRSATAEWFFAMNNRVSRTRRITVRGAWSEQGTCKYWLSGEYPISGCNGVKTGLKNGEDFCTCVAAFRSA